ncbi:MAG: 4Fe-4S dicluster domain-containing protein [Desulfitobacteriaceae bacterium]|nr:4Fe-4S dicluster domain-containing protein [Desulfitobacteriaceae bacterium]MDI6880555.1 4Fe-4S dicluster domain-containing protein [Desulfitobacteriaceae bacterium]MDI6914629.1 4Fe-4S dicluster domain-containing protein [Desulfitobacteriaceae bacterium]
MPGLTTLPQNKDALTEILDTGRSPVARFRLLSGGISPNHLLDHAEEIVGQKACLACGNCIDACPVVLREVDDVNLQIYRTSLHLETIVDDSCLRCYGCIKACPQVDRPLKLFAAKHRFTEKIVHWWMAIAYILTAGTGILLNHFRGDWSNFFVLLDSFSHKTGAVMWLLAPFLFYYFDRYHFQRTIHAISSLSNKDLAWWKARFRFWFGKGKRTFEGEYNPGQKVWYFVVLGTMLVLGTTGIIRWIWEDTLPKDTLSILIGIHVTAAYVMDISFIYHFGRKLLFRAVRRTRQIFRDAYTVEKQPKPSPSLVSREGEP